MANHSINQDSPTIEYKETYYKFRGEAKNALDADAVLLTKTKNGKEFYSAKIRAYSDGILFNPLEHNVRKDTMLVEVSKTAFDYYCRFLETENKLYITHAERERNG